LTADDLQLSTMLSNYIHYLLFFAEKNSGVINSRLHAKMDTK